MSGRHRKPSNTSRTVAKVAATGAMLGGASLLFSANSANAATDAEWDQVAACESGGNWGINTGNGYQGGLQFSQSTWSAYGGNQFASSAHNASKAQQIAIAEKVLAGQGKGAWPVCGTGLGASTPRTVKASAPAQPAKANPAKKVTTPKPAVKKPAVKKPAAKAPAVKAAKKAATTVAPRAASSSNVQQMINQTQSAGHKIDPAILAMLQQAAAKGY